MVSWEQMNDLFGQRNVCESSFCHFHEKKMFLVPMCDSQHPFPIALMSILSRWHFHQPESQRLPEVKAP